MYYFGWLGTSILPFLLPWVVGNILMLTNLYFTTQGEYSDAEKKQSAFKWYEERAVVAEKNTQFLISIIAFLLPLSATLIGKEISGVITTIFCLNITSACIAIGLIWVPAEKIKIMSFLKSIKTIFHLFTISLLLLNATLIIVT